MLKLYHCAQSRSVRPRWLLEEMGVPYEIERIDLAAGDNKKPAYLKVNPTGKVPALADGDVVLFESAAICQYLADKFPEKRMAPKVGSAARGHYYQWIHFAMCALEPPIVTIFLHTIRRPEAERNPALVAEARPQLAEALGVLAPVLRGRPFLLGDDFSVADIMAGSTLGWALMLGMVTDADPALQQFVQRMGTRPAFQRANAD